MNKMQNLGRSLTKNEQKKIFGGNEVEEIGGEGCIKVGATCKQSDDKCCTGSSCGGCADTGYECTA